MEPEPETVKVYSSYTEAQKRATKKYREQNKEKVNAQRKKYYDERKSKDPNFLSYKREKAKEYYIKKKGVKEGEEGCEEGEDLSNLIPQLTEAIKILDTKEDDVTTEESKTPPITEPKTPKAPRKPRLKKEQGLKENIKPEDLKELEAELLKALDVVDIIHGEPMIPQEVPDTIEEHYEKKAKKPRVKRTIAKEE
jgi:hypothetical protein